MPLPITIEPKVNSPEMQAFLAAFGANEKLTAEEINEMIAGVNELHQIFTDNAGLVNTATALVRGVLKLAGDLAGTADDPRIVKLLNFAYAGSRKRDLMIQPNGDLTADSVVEFEKTYLLETALTTLAQLSAAYPAVVLGQATHVQGFTVVAPNVTAGVEFYKKYGDSDNEWLRYSNATGWIKVT